MNSDRSQSLVTEVESVVARVAPVLTGGMPPEQAQWALARFRDTVLPRRLRSAEGAPADFRRELVNVVAEEILEQFEALTPEQKWDAVREAWFAERLLPLSEEAFELAQAAYRAQAPGAELRDRAAAVGAQVEAIAAEMDREAPEVAPPLADIISEALQDCASVLTDTELLSLRMGEVVAGGGQEEASELLEGSACPACGAANRREDGFCRQCGAPIACRHCRALLPRGARFCGACGRPVTSGD